MFLTALDKGMLITVSFHHFLHTKSSHIFDYELTIHIHFFFSKGCAPIFGYALSLIILYTINNNLTAVRGAVKYF